MYQADKNLFEGTLPGLQVPVLDTQIAKSAQQAGDAGLLLLGVEGVYQLVAIIGQFQGFQGELTRYPVQLLLPVEPQLFPAQLGH